MNTEEQQTRNKNPKPKDKNVCVRCGEEISEREGIALTMAYSTGVKRIIIAGPDNHGGMRVIALVALM